MNASITPLDDYSMETGGVDRPAIYAVAQAHYGPAISVNSTPLFVIVDKTRSLEAYSFIIERGGVRDRYTFEFEFVGDYEMHYFVEGDTLFVKAIE